MKYSISQGQIFYQQITDGIMIFSNNEKLTSERETNFMKFYDEKSANQPPLN